MHRYHGYSTFWQKRKKPRCIYARPITRNIKRIQKRKEKPRAGPFPRQVWCWDMTYLPAEVTGRWFYLYLILDLYSRKIVQPRHISAIRRCPNSRCVR